MMKKYEKYEKNDDNNNSHNNENNNKSKNARTSDNGKKQTYVFRNGDEFVYWNVLVRNHIYEMVKKLLLKS